MSSPAQDVRCSTALPSPSGWMRLIQPWGRLTSDCSGERAYSTAAVSVTGASLRAKWREYRKRSVSAPWRSAWGQNAATRLATSGVPSPATSL